jgi:tetratricopeptide (TPR) repeat protein
MLHLVLQQGSFIYFAFMKTPGQQAEALKDKGNKLVQKGKTNEAIVAYREAIKCDPSYIPAYANLGMVLSMTGDVEEAEKIYLSGMRVNPGDYRLSLNAGIFYIRTGQPAKSIKLLSGMLSQIPEDEKADSGAMGSLYLSIAYLQQEEFEQALLALRNALDLNHEIEPNALELLEETINEKLESYEDESAVICMAAYVEFINGDASRAAKKFQQVIEEDNNSADAYFGLGLALGEPQPGDSPLDKKTNARINNAVKALESAARLKPRWLEAHYYIGVLSLKLPDFESPHRAFNALNQVIELAKEKTPDNKFVAHAKKLLQTNEVLKTIAR